MKTAAPLLPFKHQEILQTAVPLGGIGAGCVCLNGFGGLQDFSIRGNPNLTALPDTFDLQEAAFALLRVGGASPVTRLVEGPMPAGRIYNQGLKGQGFRQGGYEGLPRFQSCELRSGYPFAEVALSDPRVPVTVRITGWSPFIPRDDVASGVPCAILEYALKNRSKKRVDIEFSYHLSHLCEGAIGKSEGTRNGVIPGKGVFFSNTEPSNAESFGTASLTVIGHRPKIKAMWLRGAWFDSVSALWHEIESGKFTANDGCEDSGKKGRNGGSILIKAALAPGQEITVPVVITWHFPNSELRSGEAVPVKPGSPQAASPAWRKFYVSQWKDAREVAGYVQRNYNNLRERTVAFQRALLGSSHPPAVLDAISANLAIVKSPTILRQENGSLWGWEGCFPTGGSCAGSCTHVWNYAQALAHLFPELERTLREQELKRSMDERGHVNFRAAIPDGPTSHNFHAAADGQLGGIMKLYRDWQICGDTEWLRELYPLAKKSIDYCIRQWDPGRKGALFEPHHNTYDIEFWGADGMCTSIYIGALCAMALMATSLGLGDEAKPYRELAERGARHMERNLFNGEYFEQKVQYRDLKDKSFLDLIQGRTATGEGAEKMRLLKKEGPSYQYGTGCLSDGVIGAWMARIYGIATPLSAGNIRRNLQSIHRYNFRRDLSEHANPQRSGYAIGSEPGLLLCSWPRGGKPMLPFVYSDEVWTGIEYQVASHMIAEGLVETGLEIVKATRSRYDGRVRNPWNEYECGNYYARAMASFALLGALSGFRYSAPEQTLWFGPKLARRPFVTFFSTAAAHGTITLNSQSLKVEVLEGELWIERLILTLGKKETMLPAGKSASPGRPLKIAITKKQWSVPQIPSGDRPTKSSAPKSHRRTMRNDMRTE